MTTMDQKTFFTALAFTTVLLKNSDYLNRPEAERVATLAELIEAFCKQHKEELEVEKSTQGRDAERERLLCDAIEALQSVADEGYHFSTEQMVDRVLDTAKKQAVG
jgi:predicted site-specific integrase-resolvase